MILQVLNLVRLFWGWGFSYISWKKSQQKIGEDSSTLTEMFGDPFAIHFKLGSKLTLPKFNVEPKNDGFQVRNLLFLLVPFSGEPC